MTVRCAAILALILLGVLTGSPSLARDRGQSSGTAIAPLATISPVSVPSDSDVVLSACFTNGQPSSGRQLQAGDALTLGFGAGVVSSCDVVVTDSAVMPPWTCEVAGGVVTLRYSGMQATWAAGDLACVDIAWRSPDHPSAVVVGAEPLVNGSIAPPEPAALVIGVATAARGGGASAIGAMAQATSTGAVRNASGDAPTPIPGLDLDVDLQAASPVLILVDAWSHQQCTSDTAAPSNLVLLVDGAGVLERRIAHDAGAVGVGTVGNTSWSWLSPVLAAGIHRFQLAVAVDDSIGAGGRSPCIGHRSEPELQTHLRLLEIVPGG